MIKEYDLLKKFLIDNLVARECDIEGTTDEKIKFLEDEIGLKLPTDYKFFLKHMGKRAGLFFNCESVFENKFPSLIRLSKRLSDKKFNGRTAPRFVFWAYYEEDFLYFVLDGSDDPSVYFFSYSQDMSVQNNGGIKRGTFWDALMEHAEEWAQYTKRRDPNWLEKSAKEDAEDEGLQEDLAEEYEEEYGNYNYGQYKLN